MAADKYRFAPRGGRIQRASARLRRQVKHTAATHYILGARPLLEWLPRMPGMKPAPLLQGPARDPGIFEGLFRIFVPQAVATMDDQNAVVSSTPISRWEAGPLAWDWQSRRSRISVTTTDGWWNISA